MFKGRPEKHIKQRSTRGFSPWYRVNSTQYEICCDCGLTHFTRYRAQLMKGKTVRLWASTRRVIWLTDAQRKRRRYRCRPS
jgi:hypothetical protein